MSEGPFNPKIPEVPQSWFAFLAELSKILLPLIAVAGSIVALAQGCQTKNVQVEHAAQIEDNKEKIERHGEKISELKAAMPPGDK